MAAPQPLEPAVFLPVPQQHSFAARSMQPPPSLTDADLNDPNRVDAALREGNKYFVAVKKARYDPLLESTCYDDERDAAKYIWDAHLARKMPDVARVAPLLVNDQLLDAVNRMQATLLQVQMTLREVQVTQGQIQVRQGQMQVTQGQMQETLREVRADNQRMQADVEDLRRMAVNGNAAMPHSPVLPFYNAARALPNNFPATRDDFDALSAGRVNALIRFYSINLRDGAAMGTKKTALRQYLHLH